MKSHPNIQMLNIGGIPLLLLFGLNLADGAIVLAPHNDTGGGGTRFTVVPFGLRSINEPSCRYQQVYGAPDFLSELPAGGFITGIGFGSDPEFGGAFHAVLPDIEITLAITSRGPDQLRPTFSENFGGASSVVFPRGRLILNSTGAGAPVFVNFTSPFFYDPADGNLLLDVHNFRPEEGGSALMVVGPLNASSNTFGVDTVSRVYAFDVNTPSGTTDSLGLFTAFYVTPVPEPSSMTLLLICAVIIVSRRCYRKSKQQAKLTCRRSSTLCY